jgi:protein-L-isoaspartate(D-aspartate) O-methyltransferase
MSDQAIASLQMRAHMVDSQVRPNQVNDRRVIAAMRKLARENFAPAGALAYSDADLDLGGGRVMLAPMKIARLVQLVLADNPVHVLVVGAGGGYGAAMLAECGAQVVALEEDARLAARAGTPGVERVAGPLVRGWPGGGPYDAILVEGAVPEIPPCFAGQLVPGGRLVAVVVANGVGRAVLAEPVGASFAMVPMFDCGAKIIPAFRPAPVFSF